MPVKFGQKSLRFWFFLSYLITTVKSRTIRNAGGGAVNPIPTGGGRLCPTHYYPKFLDGAASLTTYAKMA